MHETFFFKKKDNYKKKRRLKGKGGGRLKHCNVDGDVPLCLGKTEEKSKDGSSSNEKNNEEKMKAETAQRAE